MNLFSRQIWNTRGPKPYNKSDPTPKNWQLNGPSLWKKSTLKNPYHQNTKTGQPP